jgi:hypothetical protein
MSYNLAFWRYRDNHPHDHNATYDSLMDGKRLDFIESLPIALIRTRIAEVFDGLMKREADAWENGDGAFMLETSAQFVVFVCTHSTNTDYFNMMIDIMKEFECPLYDPQTEVRYEG